MDRRSIGAGRQEGVAESGCGSDPAVSPTSMWGASSTVGISRTVPCGLDTSRLRDERGGMSAATFFQPEVHLEQVADTGREEAAGALAKFLSLPVEAVDEFQALVEVTFTSMLEALPVSIRGNRAALRSAWIVAEYYPCMALFVREYKCRGLKRSFGV